MNNCRKAELQKKLSLFSMQVKLHTYWNKHFLCSLQISTILIFHYLVDIYVVTSSAKEACEIEKWLYYMRFFIHVRAAHNPKVVSSNLAPATKTKREHSSKWRNCEREKQLLICLNVLFYYTISLEFCQAFWVEFLGSFFVDLKTARLTMACTRRQIRRQKYFFHRVGIFCRQAVAKKKWDNVKNVCRVKK